VEHLLENTSQPKKTKDDLDKLLQDLIFILTKRETKYAPVVMYITDTETCSENTAFYNSISMQLLRLDVKIIIISLISNNEYKQELGIVNSNERLKLLAMMSRGFFINYEDFPKILEI
jgi:hypothetical protein